MGNHVPVARALLSAFDKTGIVDLGRQLSDLGIELLSTGGTAAALQKAGLRVTTVEQETGQGELFEGRVKTLHPKVHAGILARRDVPSDMRALAEMGARAIDLVVVNLYPFERTVEAGALMAEAIEMIDVGGPTMIRAAAKNHRFCAPVVNPARYDDVVKELASAREVSARLRETLAVEAFEHTAYYDAVIAQWLRTNLRTGKFPAELTVPMRKLQDLRYGENAHQEAAFYQTPLAPSEPSMVRARQVHGKVLSFNNIVDVDAALECVKEFDAPAVVIVKHATPCGVAEGTAVRDAFDRAFATDTYSPFGGIVAANREVDLATAEALGKLFLECVLAPGYAPAALALLCQKKSLRLLELPWESFRRRGLSFKSVVGGAVVQDRDVKELDPAAWKVVSRVAPTADQLRDMLFAMRCVRHVKSNSVVFVKDGATVGIGGGQTSRVDATWIAIKKGGERIRGSVLASDAFFPFRDGVDAAADAGVAAIVHPGGSIRDEEVVAAANDHGLAMVFTGQRAFRH